MTAAITRLNADFAVYFVYYFLNLHKYLDLNGVKELSDKKDKNVLWVDVTTDSFKQMGKYIKKVKCDVFVPYALIASTMGDGARKSLQKKHNFRLKPYEASHFLPMEKGDQLSSDIESFVFN